jgi:iron complex transport system substrate-binding protein
MIQRLQTKQSEIAAQHADRSPRKILWVVQREPLCVAGTDTFLNQLIQIAGGVNAIGQTTSQYPRISNEEVLRSPPEVIIEPVMDPAQSENQRATAVSFYKRFNSVPAVQNGRIYVIDGDLVSRLGPRLDETLQMISQCIWEQ